jgi:PAS domain S-box-containing protein
MLDQENTKTVLLVEDDAGIAELIKERLEESGVHITHVMSGAAARSQIEADPPGLILLDYTLPDLSGDELVAQLGALPGGMPPFIVTTGADDIRVAIAMMKGGARDFLVKDRDFLEVLPRVVVRVLRELSTERDLVEAEKALRESEQRYRLLFEQVGDYVLLLESEPEGRLIIIDANDAALRAHGYTRDEMFGQPITLLDPFLQPGQVQARMTQIEEQEKLTFSSRHRRKDGSFLDVEVRASFVLTAGRRIAVAVERDITERKRAEEAQRSNLERLSLALDAANAGTWEWDLRTNQNIWSDELWELYGLEAHSLVPSYEAWFQTIHPRDRGQVAQTLREAVAGGHDLRIEWQVVGGKDPERWLMSHGRPQVGRDGRIDRYIGIVLDITWRKQAEAALRESEERLKQAVHLAQMGIWDWDFKTDRVEWYGDMFRIYGIAPQEFTHSGRDYLESTRPDYRSQHSENIQKAFARGITEAELQAGKVSAPDPQELCIVRPDGTECFTIEDALAIVDSDGRPGRMLGITLDITERKQAEKTIRAALLEREALLRELYHRTKNNMQVIQGMLSLHAEKLPDAKTREVFEEVAAKIQGMALVHQMLYQSQNLSQIDFKRYIEELTRLLSQQAHAFHSAVYIETDLRSIQVPVEIAVPCGLVLNELVSNAYKHAFPSGASGCIRISTREEADRVIVLEVADNGVGFPPGFDYRNSETLGLRTIVALVESQLQGQVTYISPPGVTCQFRFINEHASAV